MSESPGSETHVPVGGGIIKDLRIDENTGSTTVRYAYCAGCGKYLSPTEWSRCSMGDLACPGHTIQFEASVFCRPHFEQEVISKRACKIAFCMTMGFKPDRAGKLARMDEKQVGEAVLELQRRGYLVVTDFIFWWRYRLTDRGYSAIRINAFKDDPDFDWLLKKVGRDFDGS